jgi:hypothetical protein
MKLNEDDEHVSGTVTTTIPQRKIPQPRKYQSAVTYIQNLLHCNVVFGREKPTVPTFLFPI